MKGGSGSGGGRKIWLVSVLFLVFLSMFVPLAFLLGLHNGFVPVQQQPSVPIEKFDKPDAPSSEPRPEKDQGSHIDDLVRQLGPTLPKDVRQAEDETFSRSATQRGTPMLPDAVTQPSSETNHTKADVMVRTVEQRAGDSEDIGKMCEPRYGSYCLWREENKEDMKDAKVKKLKDQLFVARAYYPTIAKIPSQSKLAREMKQNIQELERVLSESITDADLPPLIDKKLQRMEIVIAKSKLCPVDCNNVDKKLRQIFDLTEDEANFHMKQSAFIYHLAVQTMPKSLHCFYMRLSLEYFKSSPLDLELSAVEKLSDPSLHHYVILSKNVIATSVAINSTVMHARVRTNLVFHVLTDRQNYFAMKLWFVRNTYREAVVQILNIEQLKLDYQDKATLMDLHLPVEFRVSFLGVDSSPTIHNRTRYLSIFSHSHYLLPEIFPNLKKVVILDDDVVVQQDLSSLWSLNMDGKVNGAVQSCSIKLGHLKNYLGGGSFDKDSCSWMSGLNVIDLARWRELDLTNSYWRYVKETHTGEGSIEAVALRATLLTFQNLIYALDDKWALSGLGHDYEVDTQTINKAAVLHYNGNMKPWLELGIPRYKLYWKMFLKREDQFLSECNVNP